MISVRATKVPRRVFKIKKTKRKKERDKEDPVSERVSEGEAEE